MTEMTLDDLRVGDVVKTRGGCYLIVLSNDLSKNGLGLFSKETVGCHSYLSNYNNDLTYCDSRNKNNDIVAVCKLSKPNKRNAYTIIESIMCNKYGYPSNSDRLIEWDWVREEVKKMTIDEIEKELGYKIEIVSTKGE